jgi:hypothetical protein
MEHASWLILAIVAAFGCAIVVSLVGCGFRGYCQKQRLGARCVGFWSKLADKSQAVRFALRVLAHLNFPLSADSSRASMSLATWT